MSNGSPHQEIHQADTGDELRKSCSNGSGSAPSDESATAGTDPVADATRSVTTRADRDAHGRFIKGNVAAGKSLSRSEALWSALGEVKGDLVDRLKSDLAVDGDAAATLEGLLDAYAEARLLRQSLFARMAEMGGPITAKGRVRALYSGYLSAVDRERRLALDLGLDRKARSVDVARQLSGLEAQR